MSLQPARYNIKIWSGATYRKRFTLVNPDNTNKDLSGYDGELIVRDQPGGTQLLLLNVSNGGISFGGASGTIDLLIGDADTADLDFTSAVYDFTITDPEGNVDPLIWGAVTVGGI